MHYSPEDYEDEVRRFEWNIPEDYNIVDVVAGHAEDNPDRVAIFLSLIHISEPTRPY